MVANGGSSAYTAALADKYYRKITGGKARPVGSVARLSSPVVGNSNVKRGGQSILEQMGDPSTGIGKIVDILSQPVYAGVESAKEQNAAAALLMKGDVGGAAKRAAQSTWIGNLGHNNDKQLPSDILRGDKDLVSDVAEMAGSGYRPQEDMGPLAANKNDTILSMGAKFAGGLGADVAFDPLTYVPGGLAKSAGGQILKGAAKAAESSAARGSKLGADASEFLYKFGKIKRPGTETPDLGIVDAELEPPTTQLRPDAENYGDGTYSLAGAGREPLQIAADRRVPFTPDARTFGPDRQIAGGAPRAQADSLPATVAPVERTSEGAIPMGPGRSPVPTVDNPTETMLRHTETGEIRPFSQELLDQTLPGGARYSEELERLKAGVWKDDPNFVAPKEPRVRTPKVVEPEPPKVETPSRRAAAADADADRKAFASWVKADPERGNMKITEYQAGDPMGEATIASLRQRANASIEELMGVAKAAGFRDRDAIIKFAKDYKKDAQKSLDVYRTRQENAPWRSAPSAVENARLSALPGEGSLDTARRLRAAQQPAQVGRKARSEATAAARGERLARARRAAAIRMNRGNFAYRNWIQKAQESLDVEDIVALLATRSGAEFDDVMKELAKKTLPGNKAWEPFVVPILRAEKVIPDPVVPQTAFSEALQEVDTAAEQMLRAAPEESPVEEAARMEVASGFNLSDETKEAVERAGLEQKIVGKPKAATRKSGGQKFAHKTATGVPRTSSRPGQGFARNKGLNRYWQMNLNAELIASPTGKAIRDRMTTALEELDDAAEEIGMSKLQKGREAARIYREANEEMAEYVIAELRKVEDAFIANGNWPHASGEAGGIPLRLTQVYDALSQSGLGRALITNRMFNPRGGGRIFGKTSLPADAQRARGVASVEPILRIAERIVNMAADPLNLSKAENTAEEIAKISRQIVADMANKGELRDFIETALKGEYPGRPIPGISTSKNGNWEQVTPQEAKAVADQVFEAFTDTRVMQVLLQSAHTNAAQAGIQFGHAVKKISSQAYESIISKVDDMSGNTTTGEKMEAMTQPAKMVEETPAAQLDPAVGPVELDASKQLVKENLTEVIPEIDIKVAEIQRRASAPKIADEPIDSPQAVHEGVDNGNEQYHEVVMQALDENPVVLLDDLNGTSYAMQTGIFRMLDATASRFVNHYGNAALHNAAIQPRISGGIFREMTQKELAETDHMARGIAAERGINTRQVWKETFDAIQKGTRDELPPNMADFGAQVNRIMDYMFGVPKADGSAQPLLSYFQRNGFDFEHINRIMSNPRYKIPEAFRFVTEAPGVPGKKGKKFSAAQVAEQWRSWDVEDPLDFLAKMDRVANDLATDTAISREAWRLGKQFGMMSDTPKAGFIKVPRNTRDSTVLRYLPYDKTGHVYMSKQAWEEIKRMDEILAPRKDSPWNNFVMNNLEPLVSLWKFGMTVARPGHHVRTLIGDSSMAFLHSGVKDMRYYIRSAQMLKGKQAAMGRTLRGDYGGWDALAALQGIHRTPGHGIADEIARTGGIDGPYKGVAATIKQGGKEVPVNEKVFQKALMDRGVLPNFRQQEDIIDDLTNENAITHKIARGTRWKGSAGQRGQKWTSGKIGRFTEGRDDFVRQAHAIHLLEHGIGGKAWDKKMSLDDIFDKVADEVRRAHPDGTDLTPFEKNNMRLAFPFYSWTRKAIPLVIENMFAHPGRFMVYPKAMYNFAQAQGIDLESMTEPFPEDQMFPDFLRENMTGIAFATGDAGLFSRPNSAGNNTHYWTGDVGAVQADVLNQFAPTNGGVAGTIRGAAGFLNPAIKTPFELLTNARVDTGQPITDKTDYIDQQIPGLNWINSAAGVSPTGTIGNVLEGDPSVELNRARERGIREADDPEYLANLLAGQKLYDTTKPNLVRLGQIDMRDFITRMNETHANK